CAWGEGDGVDSW
nr:immunoglobulin heavy chain junction region [Macaca mulatta]